ncbi:MAG: hypothetical protein ABIO70_30645 [Pseudomonadota bacterium]
MQKRTLTLTLLTLAGCAFTTYEPLVTCDDLLRPKDAAMSLSADGAYLFAADFRASPASYAHALRVFDASTGAALASVTLPFSQSPIALAPDHGAGHEDDVWVLRPDGTRVQYDASLVTTRSIGLPIPTTGATAAADRYYCDMDRDEAGVTYITTYERDRGTTWSAYLYREEGGAWDRVVLGEVSGCARVSSDDLSDTVGVLDIAGHALSRYDAGDLTALDCQDLTGHAGTPWDLDVEGGFALLAYRDSSGGDDDLVLYDDAGAEEDGTFLDRVAAVQLGGDGGEVWAWWTGLDAGSPGRAAGRFQIE